MAERYLGVNRFKHLYYDHYICIKGVLELYDSKEKLDILQKRSDIDTVCGYEYYQMKKGVLEQNILDYEAMNNKYFKKINIPPPL